MKNRNRNSGRTLRRKSKEHSLNTILFSITENTRNRNYLESMGANISVLITGHINIDNQVYALVPTQQEFDEKDTVAVIVDTTFARITGARIYSPGQGFAAEIIENPSQQLVIFSNNLSHGSWYDIEFVVDFKRRRVNTATVISEKSSYLLCGVYCSIGKVLNINDIVRNTNKLAANTWTCKCGHVNRTKIPICKNCSRHCNLGLFGWLGLIPVLGMPFNVAYAVLKAGQACVTRTSGDQLDAIIAVLFAAADVVLTPFLVVRLVSLGIQLGVEVGVKTLNDVLRLFPVDKFLREFLKDVVFLSRGAIKTLTAAIKNE